MIEEVIAFEIQAKQNDEDPDGWYELFPRKNIYKFSGLVVFRIVIYLRLRLL
ncbi:MAG: hypothetical protein IH840_16420 [Candidatus Heimdallarchaeota archaeon]|nr:hypothetical protein [Candidatus Heimdallarchaeota archaeon]